MPLNEIPQRKFSACATVPNNALLLAGTKLKSTYKSLELTTATRLPTVIKYSPKFYNII